MTADGPKPILVLNAGSSSIKAVAFDADLRPLTRTEVAGIGTGDDAPANHAAALDIVLDRMAETGLTTETLGAVAHRVVHGGKTLTQAARITPEVRAAIAACIPLAPLHNPHHLAAIDCIAALAPALPQCASFDTAFHANQPEVARRYALPDMPQTDGLQRYGFHGTSYAAMVNALRASDDGLPRRLLALHLGNGASACAILEGQSFATTMGYSPLAGLTMGTRSGDLDPGAVLELARRIGIDAAEDLLNKQSGLLGMSGLTSDMRRLEAVGTPEAAFAIAHFCYWAARHAGSLIAAMGGIDAVAFTGGIGENSGDIREKILENLQWAGNFPTLVVPAAEEAHIARETASLLKEA